MKRSVAKIRKARAGKKRRALIAGLHDMAEEQWEKAGAIAALASELELLDQKLRSYRLPRWARQAVKQRMNEIFDKLGGPDQQQQEKFAEFFRTSSDYVRDPLTGNIRKVTKQ